MQISKTLVGKGLPSLSHLSLVPCLYGLWQVPARQIQHCIARHIPWKASRKVAAREFWQWLGWPANLVQPRRTRTHVRYGSTASGSRGDPKDGHEKSGQGLPSNGHLLEHNEPLDHTRSRTMHQDLSNDENGRGWTTSRGLSRSPSQKTLSRVNVDTDDKSNLSAQR